MNNTGCRRIREKIRLEENYIKNRKEQKSRFLKKIGR